MPLSRPAIDVQLAFDRLANAKSPRFDPMRFVPLLAIVLLTIVIAGLAYLLLQEDRSLRRDALHRDADTLAQSIALRLQTINEAVTSIARSGDASADAEKRFRAAALELMANRPEVERVAWIDAAGGVTWSIESPGPFGEAARPSPTPFSAQHLLTAIGVARQAQTAFFTAIQEEGAGTGGEGRLTTDLVAPIFGEERFAGAVLARVSIGDLLRQSVRNEMLQRYRYTLADDQGKALASTSASPIPGDAQVYTTPIWMLPDGVLLQASAFRDKSPLLSNALVWVIAALVCAILVMLLLLARHDARQSRVERALRAETAFRRAMENSLATGLRVIDRAGVIRHVNTGFCQMTGWSEAELVGLGPPYPYWPPERRAEHQQRLEEVLAGATTGSFEMSVMRKDGTLFDARMYVSPLLSDEGDHLGWMSAMADVTEPKRISEQLAAAHEKVQLTARLMTMGEMASSLAHELNQPLTAISNYSMGAVSRVKEGELSIGELLPTLEKTAGQAQRAGTIIRRIREFVKRAEPRRRPTAAARIVEDAVGFAEIEAAKKGVRIRTDVDPTLPPLDVDPILIEQLLLNLLKNAIESMDQSTHRVVDLKVARVDDAAEFSVIDRGSGIAPSLRPHLFQPFFSTKTEGMGMGLNICRSIVEFHQGRLVIEDNPEGGAIFRITLPLVETALADVAKP